MRDLEIHRMNAFNAKRMGLILAQLEFVKTRQEARENVMLSSSLWLRMRFFWNPRLEKAIVDAVQRRLLDQAAEEMEAASNRSKIVTPDKTLVKAVPG